MSVMKAIDVTIGQELRALCETAQKALDGTSRREMPTIMNEVRTKHSLIALSIGRRARSRFDTLLAEISHGRVTLSMELCNQDKLYAAWPWPQRLLLVL